RTGDRRAEALSPRPPRSLGQGHARVVLRSRRTWRRARDGGAAHVRRGLGGSGLRHGAGRELAGVAMTDVALASGTVSEVFFPRARAGPPLGVPTAPNDPSAKANRGAPDLAPVGWERAGVTATRPAAVLVPVVDRSEPAVLLTLRTELPSHPG